MSLTSADEERVRHEGDEEFDVFRRLQGVEFTQLKVYGLVEADREKQNHTTSHADDHLHNNY